MNQDNFSLEIWFIFHQVGNLSKSSGLDLERDRYGELRELRLVFFLPDIIPDILCCDVTLLTLTCLMFCETFLKFTPSKALARVSSSSG